MRTRSRGCFRSGDWLAICDRCGFEHFASQLKQEWTGLRVCHECWEPRHPQEFVTGREDDQAPPWVRPDVPGEAVGVTWLASSTLPLVSSTTVLASSGGRIITPEDL